MAVRSQPRPSLPVCSVVLGLVLVGERPEAGPVSPVPPDVESTAVCARPSGHAPVSGRLAGGGGEPRPPRGRGRHPTLGAGEQRSLGRVLERRRRRGARSGACERGQRVRTLAGLVVDLGRPRARSASRSAPPGSSVPGSGSAAVSCVASGSAGAAGVSWVASRSAPWALVVDLRDRAGHPGGQGVAVDGDRRLGVHAGDVEGCGRAGRRGSRPAQRRSRARSRWASRAARPPCAAPARR